MDRNNWPTALGMLVLVGVLTGCPLVPNDLGLPHTVATRELKPEKLPPQVIAASLHAYPNQQIVRAFLLTSNLGEKRYNIVLRNAAGAESRVATDENGKMLYPPAASTPQP